MKSLLLSMFAALAVAGLASNVSQAEDRISGFRYVDEPADIALGEVKRTKSYNLAGDLVGLTVSYKNGKVRNEKFEKGVLRFVHETDFKGWSKDAEINKSGTLVSETEHLASGKSIVFVNVDAIDVTASKDVHLAVGDELHLVYTTAPWPGSRGDAVSVKKRGIINALTTLPAAPQNAKLIAAGSFVAFSKGDTEIKTTTTMITAGFAGPQGRPPQSRSTDSLVKVHVK
jgi:hypothetical protein